MSIYRMKKQLATIVFSFFALCVHAALPMNVECVGTAKQVENGNDTLFFFKDEIHMKADTVVNWYRTDGTLFQSDAEEIYPDEGGYYIVRGGMTCAPFYVFLYSDASLDSLIITPDCDMTTLSVVGDAQPFTYTRPDGTTGRYARACTINYNDLAWNSEEWVDSAALMAETLRNGVYYTLPPLYAATPITLCYDTDIRMALGLDSACIQTELIEDSVHAVKIQLTSLVTTRGQDGERSNERNRPTSQDLITGSEYSGPLEVAFYSNPTPAAKFFSWSIYRTGDLIATRRDQDIRYTFSQPGGYRVVCKVKNEYCTSDSMEVTVSISESYLAVPNVFTPDNDPGQKNEEFRVAYRSLREFHCWVYNRWGKLVYEWTDPAKGWDGTINGRPASEGAYYYVIRALGTDAVKNAKYIGKASFKKKKMKADESLIGVYQMSGCINLLRGKR